MPDPNPYVSAGLFVGRSSELRDVVRRLQRGESVLLIGGRRCGKTSLVRQIGDIGRRVVQLDAQGWTLDSEAGAIAAMGKGLAQFCSTREQLEAVLKAAGPLAIVIDEADHILHCDWAGKFLSYLRYLDGTLLRMEVAFVLVGGPELCGYQNPADGGSPPLNIAEPVYLAPLDYAARRELLALWPAAASESDIFEAVGGHPWLLVRLLARLWDNADLESALDGLFAAAMIHFQTWKKQLGADGAKFLQKIPVTGVSKAALRNDPRWKPFKEAAVMARSVCLTDTTEDGRSVLPRPRIFRDWLQEMPEHEQQYDLAISYASPDHALARKIWSQLDGRPGKQRPHRVFFAEEETDTFGASLNTILPDIFGPNSRYILVLASEAYVRSYWASIELKAALKHAVNEGRLLVLDLGSVPPEIPVDIVVKRATPEGLVELISVLDAKLNR